MTETGFHFAQSAWLWGLILIPVVLSWLFFSKPFRRQQLAHLYADAELLPSLLGSAVNRQIKLSTRPLLIWSLAWASLILAMAGPRWDYHQISAFESTADLVVLLDISASMNIRDVQPSRMDRAKQEAQDLLQKSKGMRTGLIAFASIAHVVTPITEDNNSILQQLPHLSPALLRMKGSRLSDALDLATALFKAGDKEISHHILLISDGEFSDSSLSEKIAALTTAGVQLHILGIGTTGGGPVVVAGKALVAQAGGPVLSRLEQDSLEQLAKQGNGIYRTAVYGDDDLNDILSAIQSTASSRVKENSHSLVWDEYFPWLVSPALIMLLLLYGNRARSRSLT